MSVWQRNLLKEKINQIDKGIDHRKWLTSLYESFLREKGIKTFELPDCYYPVFLRYPVLVRDKRKTLKDAKRRNIEMGDWRLSPVHPKLDGWEKVFYKKGQCPIAKHICNHIINLPTHTGITKKEILSIVAILEDNLSLLPKANP